MNNASQLATEIQAVVLPSEVAEYERLRAGLLADIAPQGALQEVYFEQLLHAAWDQRRFRLAEAKLAREVAAHIAEPLLDPKLEARVKLIDRYLRHADQCFRRAMNELRRLQTEKAVRRVAEEPNQTVEALATGLADSAKIAKAIRAKRRGSPQSQSSDRATVPAPMLAPPQTLTASRAA